MKNLFWFLLTLYIMALVVPALSFGCPFDECPPGLNKHNQSQQQGQAQAQQQGQAQGQISINVNKNTNKNVFSPTINITTEGPPADEGIKSLTLNQPISVEAPAVADITVNTPENTQVIGGKAFRQFMFLDSDGFPALPEYNGPWTGPSWNVLPLEYLPANVTPKIAKGWLQGDYKCEWYPSRTKPAYSTDKFSFKQKSKDGKLPIKETDEVVGFAFCRATFNGTTLSMAGDVAVKGMEAGGTTAIILGASEEFSPRNWSLGINLGAGAGLLSGNEGDRTVSARGGIGASYGGSSKNQGQGLVWMIVDEFPEK